MGRGRDYDDGLTEREASADEVRDGLGQELVVVVELDDVARSSRLREELVARRARRAVPARDVTPVGLVRARSVSHLPHGRGALAACA